MNYATFPSTVDALMQLILRHYPKGQQHTGPTMISEAEFAEGIGHAFTQMHALVLTNKRREFCWSLAQFVNRTLIPLLTAKHPYLYDAVSAVMSSAGLELRNGVTEQEIAGRFDSAAKPGSDHNGLACLFVENWSEPSPPAQ